ncbi:ribonuclease E/G [Bacillus fonticola]|uniref:ribonuclease E/G n=1 Tax=Bacillus fonticola TaxID=2728853 RepID=UPI0014743F0D|nr:ribonuclease E/G [Bacillus fonticola]
MREIIIDDKRRVPRIGLFVDGQLERYEEYVSKAGPMPGSVYQGRVSTLAPQLDAAFLQLGVGTPALLHKRDIPGAKKGGFPYREGDLVFVQVEQPERGNKGAKLTGHIEWGGELLVYLPFSKYVACSKKVTQKEREQLLKFGTCLVEGTEGVLFRTAAAKATRDELQTEWDLLRDEAQAKIQSATGVTCLKEAQTFQEQVQSFCSHLLNKEGSTTVYASPARFNLYKLPQSWNRERMSSLVRGRLSLADIDYWLQERVFVGEDGVKVTIDETEAMTVFDVDSGKSHTSRVASRAAFETNKKAANLIARLIRLRNISGLFVIDFVNMDIPTNKRDVTKYFFEELTKWDSRAVQLGTISPFGVLEGTRKRIGPTEQRTQACAVCQGSGRVPSANVQLEELNDTFAQFSREDMAYVKIEWTEVMKKTWEQHKHDMSLPFELQSRIVEGDNPFWSVREVSAYRPENR